MLGSLQPGSGNTHTDTHKPPPCRTDTHNPNLAILGPHPTRRITSAGISASDLPPFLDRPHLPCFLPPTPKPPHSTHTHAHADVHIPTAFSIPAVFGRGSTRAEISAPNPQRCQHLFSPSSSRPLLGSTQPPTPSLHTNTPTCALVDPCTTPSAPVITCTTRGITSEGVSASNLQYGYAKYQPSFLTTGLRGYAIYNDSMIPAGGVPSMNNYTYPPQADACTGEQAGE